MTPLDAVAVPCAGRAPRGRSSAGRGRRPRTRWRSGAAWRGPGRRRREARVRGAGRGRVELRVDGDLLRADHALAAGAHRLVAEAVSARGRRRPVGADGVRRVAGRAQRAARRRDDAVGELLGVGVAAAEEEALRLARADRDRRGRCARRRVARDDAEAERRDRRLDPAIVAGDVGEAVRAEVVDGGRVGEALAGPALTLPWDGVLRRSNTSASPSGSKQNEPRSSTRGVFLTTRFGVNGFSLHCGARLKLASMVIVTVCGSSGRRGCRRGS